MSCVCAVGRLAAATLVLVLKKNFVLNKSFLDTSQ